MAIRKYDVPNKPLLACNKRNPHAYQLEAVNAIINVFKKNDRAQITMACGTGKTLVALWAAEQLKVKAIVVFVPSLALIAQLMHEWLKETTWKAVTSLAICSDESVSENTDSFLVNVEDCDFPVTTDPIEVNQFLNKDFIGVKIIFCTYHSSSVLAEAMVNCKPIDLAIFDEAHKTAGSNSYSLALHDKNIGIKKRLFMTATPKHYDATRLQKDGSKRLVFSMDSLKDYGPVAYHLSIRQAIEQGIICGYKIMISVSNALLKNEPSIEEKLVSFRKAIVKDVSVSKVITFHQTIKSAYLFQRHIKTIIYWSTLNACMSVV